MQKRTLLIIGIACGIAALAGVGYFIYSGPGPEIPPDDVTVGLLADESSGLVYIAQDQGYFTAHGLNLTFRSYPNGAAAIQAMKKGEVNFTLSSEFPLVAEIVNGQNLLITGSLDKYYGTVIVAPPRPWYWRPLRSCGKEHHDLKKQCRGVLPRPVPGPAWHTPGKCHPH